MKTNMIEDSLSPKQSRINLMREVTKNSVASKWAKAKLEWYLERVEMANEWDEHHCVCGQFIRELCYIRNIKNGKMLLIGNVCVHQFGQIRTKNGNAVDPELIFRGLKSIELYLTGDKAAYSIHHDLLQFLLDKKVINDWEYEFLDNRSLKRKQSTRQGNVLHPLLHKILKGMGMKAREGMVLQRGLPDRPDYLRWK